MEKIIVNYDSLFNIGNNILNSSKDFKCELENIKKITNILENSWEGTDMLKFTNTMNNTYIPTLENLNKVIEEYGSFLIDTKNKYEELDNSFGGSTE